MLPTANRVLATARPWPTPSAFMRAAQPESGPSHRWPRSSPAQSRRSSPIATLREDVGEAVADLKRDHRVGAREAQQRHQARGRVFRSSTVTSGESRFVTRARRSG